MSLLSQARAAFATAFITGVFCWSAWSIYSQGPRIVDELREMRVPRSLHEIGEISRHLTKSVCRHLAGKYASWEAHAWIQETLGKSEINDFFVIKAEDGRLYRGGLYPARIENAAELAGDIAAFAETAAEKGTKVLYLNTPDIVLKDAKHLPMRMPFTDFNAASDALLHALREKGVPYADSRYALIEAGFPTEDVSPKTSFQLSGKAAFAIFGFLLESMEKNFSLSLDSTGGYRDINNYVVTLYSDFFLGTLGKETGPAFSGLDDFTTVEPAFDTYFMFQGLDMFGEETATEGEAGLTLLHPDALLYYENIYTLYPQSYYKHANATWTKVVNTLNPGGPKMLFIHDYYSAQIISHLAPLCGELHTLAHQANLSMNAEEYIRDNDIDYVIISFAPRNILTPETRKLMTGNEDGIRPD